MCPKVHRAMMGLIPLRRLPLTLSMYLLLSSCTAGPKPVPKEAGAVSGREEGSPEGKNATNPESVEPELQPVDDAARLDPATTHIRTIVDASDRTRADRLLDPGRHPAELLSFFEISPGQHVAELAAGGGYTAELLARAVAPDGKVYGQNTPFILQRFAQAPWDERTAKPVMANVTKLTTEFDAPLPAEVRNLDAVLLVLFYHDTVWMGTDRSRMNRNIFDAIASGGIFGVVDHSAAPGAGTTVAQSLHRIEESVVVGEVTAAGFVLEERADFMRNPTDTRDWSASPREAGQKRGTSDRFVLKFRKPR